MAALDLDWKHRQEEPSNVSSVDENESGGLRFDLLLLDSEVVMYRHSLSE